MDVKALAKSKRAHSQHHSKKPHSSHQNQKLKAPSGGSTDAGSAKKPLGKQVKEKSHRSQGSSALPSNWDRYEEEFDSGSEGVSADSANKTSDVLPKSKGADYRHLVAEAQSQANITLGGSPFLDDVLPGEFNEGVSYMLAVREEGTLSWIGDDNFLVEDKTSGAHEASFLSLNLHALAENLAKVDLSERLFIESDLLPPDLCVESSAAGRNEEPNKLRTTKDSELADRMSEELSFDDFSADVKISDQLTSSSPCGSSHAASTLSSKSLVPVNYVGLKCGQADGSAQNKALAISAEDNLHRTEDPRTELSTFEPTAAEKELDMLLDSFSETKILDSPGFKSDASFPVLLGRTTVDPPQISKKEQDSSKTASFAANLDDALDDLLEETSTAMNPNGLSRSKEEKLVLHSTKSSRSGTKSQVLDDFDSWMDTI